MAHMIPPLQKNNKHLSQIVFYLSLIILFNVEIRSIGHISVVPDISILPKFWLSDIGLLLPIIWVRLLNIKMFMRPIPISIVIISFYGIFIAILRNNPLHSMGHDLRTLLAFFSGLAIILIIKEMKDVLRSIINVEIILTLAATAIIMFMPGGGISGGSERQTHPASFLLQGMPIVLFSSAIIGANSWHKMVLSYKAWLCALLLFINATIIMQTRSMFIAVGLGILFSFVTLYVFKKYLLKHKQNTIIRNAMILIICIIILGLIINNKVSNLDNFVARLKSGYTYYADAGVTIRLAEIPTVFTKMNIENHIFGMGLNPSSELIDFQGIEYNILHIGVLNIWWRFGIIVFIIVNVLILRAIGIWLGILFRRNKGTYHLRSIIAISICTPGLMVAYISGLTSGGWSASFTYALGIVYGLYIKIIQESSFCHADIYATDKVFKWPARIIAQSLSYK